MKFSLLCGSLSQSFGGRNGLAIHATKICLELMICQDFFSSAKNLLLQSFCLSNCSGLILQVKLYSHSIQFNPHLFSSVLWCLEYGLRWNELCYSRYVWTYSWRTTTIVYVRNKHAYRYLIDFLGLSWIGYPTISRTVSSTIVAPSYKHFCCSRVFSYSVYAKSCCLQKTFSYRRPLEYPSGMVYIIRS